MNCISKTAPPSSATKIFNNPNCFIEGWYWAIPSHTLKRGKIKSVNFLGRELVIYRNFEGEVVAVDAYCPHMGAHLARGKVEGKDIRCFFHHWKFNSRGACVEIPCLAKPLPVQLKTWPVTEKYGLVWVWTGETPQHSPPFVPELEHEDCEAVLGYRFRRNCHPHILMINGIDAQHFNTVHNLPLKIRFEAQEINETVIGFRNTSKAEDISRFRRFIRPFYQKEVTCKINYWYGSVSTATVGPDFLYFHIIFALRLTESGKSDGQIILVTKKRSGLLGWLANRIILGISKCISLYLAIGDTQIFETIKFDLKTPIQADRSIWQFREHLEKQSSLAWETWETQKFTSEEK
ncbi:MAG: aromatic ring-hydroxylating dioxygenase subunit alpha [Cyanobacteriota bacterium]|nr:aromatic ring-hydroxylating dioxygenase subunit alpha [Cyanobacteriota bacterium]